MSSMWKQASKGSAGLPIDVFGAVSQLKNVDVLQNVQKAKGIWNEAFELGGEKSEVQVALEEWKKEVEEESLHDFTDLDDHDVPAMTSNGSVGLHTSSLASWGGAASKEEARATAAAATSELDTIHAFTSSSSTAERGVRREEASMAPVPSSDKKRLDDRKTSSYSHSPPTSPRAGASAAAPTHSPAAYVSFAPASAEMPPLAQEQQLHGSTAAAEAAEAVQTAERELNLVIKLGAEQRQDQFVSDEQASVYDKIIHMQREKLKQLQREKALADKAALQATSMASMAQRRHNAAENRHPASPSMPLSSPDQILAAGKKVASVVGPIVRTRRGMAGLALSCFVLFLFYVTQRGVDSRGRELERGGMGHATEKLWEKAELEKLVTSLLQDQQSLVSGADKKDPAILENHVASVSKLLMKMHQDHIRSQDKVHDKLSRENEKLMGELERLNSQIKKSLGSANATTTVP